MTRDKLSRRDVLKRVGIAGAAVTIPLVDVTGAPQTAAPPTRSASSPSVERFETLSAVEGDTLEAIVQRIIPSDANGPGAKEARAAHYIDRALGGALASSHQAYSAGLAALDRYSQASRGAR